eukprot:1187344-Prorocentrum_minimum.AAC.6
MSKTLVTNIVNTQDSQEQAPCAPYWFLGLIQVPREAPGGLTRSASAAHGGCSACSRLGAAVTPHALQPAPTGVPRGSLTGVPRARSAAPTGSSAGSVAAP